MTRKPVELYVITEPESPPADKAAGDLAPPVRERTWRDLMRRLEKRRGNPGNSGSEPESI